MFSPRSTPNRWRQKLGLVADTAVAFATLESVKSVRELIGRGPGPVAVHPHRRPLERAPRAGRPGRTVARPLPCTTAAAKRRSRAMPARPALH